MYAAQYLDSESGHYYLRARYYEPTTICEVGRGIESGGHDWGLRKYGGNSLGTLITYRA